MIAISISEEGMPRHGSAMYELVLIKKKLLLTLTAVS
jgi:hypothetical protein